MRLESRRIRSSDVVAKQAIKYFFCDLSAATRISAAARRDARRVV
jgi:hypothetical protein